LMNIPESLQRILLRQANLASPCHSKKDRPNTWHRQYHYSSAVRILNNKMPFMSWSWLQLGQGNYWQGAGYWHVGSTSRLWCYLSWSCICRHKYTLFLSTDGNFQLQWKHKNGDPDDVALNQGNGYFVENAQYKEYLACVQPEFQVSTVIAFALFVFILAQKSTCSHLCAVRQQNIIKFKNADISGVVAIQCACHGFYMPWGVVDLMKGEA